MIRDPGKLRSLIREYRRRLRRLDGYTPQDRGRRLNHFIAELLQCWGIDAVASIRGSGEVDVGFELAGKHFIVEAKWEREPIGTGPIAKLQKRLRQRLSGTIGLFISMSGFSDEALRDLKEGEQLGVLLLSQEHFEAMLSGFIPPAELLGRLIARASLVGEGAVPLVSLFEKPDVDRLGINFSPFEEVSPLLEKALPGFEAEVIASSLPYGQSGVAELSPNTVLVTLQEGLFTLDLNAQVVAPWMPIPGCSRNALVDPGETVFIVRRAGVGRIRDGNLEIVAGGFCGNMCLFQGSGDAVWVFANGYPDAPNDAYPVIARLGEAVGDEVVYEVKYPPACGSNAMLIGEGRFLIVGSTGIAVADLEGTIDFVINDLINPVGLMHDSDSRYIIASGSVEVSELDVAGFSHRSLARFNLQGSVSELAKSVGGGGYLFTHYTDTEDHTKGILIRWRYR